MHFPSGPSQDEQFVGQDTHEVVVRFVRFSNWPCGHEQPAEEFRTKLVLQLVQAPVL